jgi:L-lactate dehydrogenase complex protein LldF
MRPADVFLSKSTHATANKEQRNVVYVHGQRYQDALRTARRQYKNEELAKDRAAYLKWKVTENLDKYLIDFEATLMRRGGRVVWAHDAETARKEILQLISKNGAQRVFKSKSMLSEEIELNSFLRESSIEVIETDIGEYIVDVAAEAPFHMVNPAMHKTEKEIAGLLNAKIGTSMEADAEGITSDVREIMRSYFSKAAIDVCITGANFLIADSGMVAITENEGNIRMITALANTHIVIAGIDKIIPTLNDIDTFFPLLATYGTGQKITSYNSVIGPKTPDEYDAPAEFIVVLIDNGRTNLLAQPDQRQALSCIKCGACANVCPVYQVIGGHVYGVNNSGPIGAVTQPHEQGLDEFKHLSYASSLCGNCTQVCPMKIDLHNHLLRNRRDSVQQGHAKSAEKLMWYSWKKMMLSRKNMNKGATIKNFMLKSFFKTAWGEDREFPKVAEKSFNQIWKERH